MQLVQKTRKNIRELAIGYLPDAALYSQEILNVLGNPGEDMLRRDELNEEDESAIKLLRDIEERSVFDDIQVNFKAVLEEGGNQLNTSVELERAKELLSAYNEEVSDILAQRYDECKLIIEDYYRRQIHQFK